MALRYLNVKAFLIIAIVTGLLIWFGLLRANAIQPGLTIDALKQLPTVFTIEGFLWAAFAQWGWRFRPFQSWLVPFPDLQGTWNGTIRSSWVNSETKNSIEPIAVQLVIRQSFLNIHCSLQTAESKSQSQCVCLHLDPETREKYLTCTYVNTPHFGVRDRSAIHEGTMTLQIFGRDNKSLKGDYWTSRLTRGEIELSFTARRLEEGFINPSQSAASPDKSLEHTQPAGKTVPKKTRRRVRHNQQQAH